MDDRPILSIVVPVYNNASHLAELSRRVDVTCARCCEGRYELIFVDDGSADSSWDVIRSLAGRHVRGVRLSRNFGQHSALKAGFVHCRGEYVVMMDADLEDDPELIEPILASLRDGAEICFTVSQGGGGGRLTSRIFHRFTNDRNPVLEKRVPGTMRGFTENVLNAILRYGERRPVYGPLISGLGYRQAVIERPMLANKNLRTSYTFRKRLQLAIDYIMGYTNIPTTFFFTAAFVSAFASLAYALLIIVQYVLIGYRLPPGLSLLAVLILLLFAATYLGIGMIGLYLQRLLVETLARPLFLVSETAGGPEQERKAALWESRIVRSD